MSECVLRLIPAPAVVSVPWIRDYQSPEEKPPGGMRFLLITWFVPFNDGTVVLISGLNPSPVIGLPLLSAKEATRIRVQFIAGVQNKCEQIKGKFIKSANNIKTKSSATWIKLYQNWMSLYLSDTFPRTSDLSWPLVSLDTNSLFVWLAPHQFLGTSATAPHHHVL